MDFLMEQASLFTSKEYEEIYFHLNSKHDIKYHDLFLLCASIGFKKNQKKKLDERGREFRTNFFNSRQRAAVYSIIINDPDIGKNIEAFDNSEFRLKARKRLEEYAEGGMDLLVKEVFGQRWDGNKLDPTYHEYEVDLLGYIYADSNEVPF
ncbi:hypothetical protein V7161_15000 [Neobacillus drentensis]|uniref:hypothetical protein n=1 Tax=Neobacillus drentensis TaxID=220684 RepID=UPI0030020174